ncbi:MAG TPA: HAD-IB family phosphatase [Thermoplasmata archaeon]|nr:HAD-IB family phosphatase [Thermoplasmata archaeon]
MRSSAADVLRMWVDFDGTLVEPNVAIILVAEFARDGERVANEIDEELHAGKITLRQAWERQVALLPADRMEEMARWAVRNTPLRSGAHELLELLDRHHVPTAIVSGGLDFYIGPILKHSGIDLPVFSDALAFQPPDRLVLSHPYGHATCRLCGICKAQTVRDAFDDRRRSVFIGDGSTDKFAAEVADIVFARRRLRSYCEASKIPYVAFEEFGPVTEKLRRWFEGEEPLPAPRHLGLADSACPISRACDAAT